MASSSVQTVLSSPNESPPPGPGTVAEQVPTHALSLSNELSSPLPWKTSFDVQEFSNAAEIQEERQNYGVEKENVQKRHFDDVDKQQQDEEEEEEHHPVSTPPPRPTMAPIRTHPEEIKITPHVGTKVQGTPSMYSTDTVPVEASLLRQRDIAAALSGLPRVKPQWTHNYLKIIIVGEDGLGKTTFVRNLFAAYATDVEFPVADGTNQSFSEFFPHPERLCTELVVRDDDSMVWWHYLVQDTPGYGDFWGGGEDVAPGSNAKDQQRAILDHITSCSHHYLGYELDPHRRAALHHLPDCRVDVCLYFLPPHHLRRADVDFLDKLSSLIPVVPILAKADTMTADELKQYRTHVGSVLYGGGSDSGDISGKGMKRDGEKVGVGGWGGFSREALESAGAHHGPPFAVVASSTIDRSVGRFWPVRQYPRGRCESLLTAHSELPVLRRLLFETGYWELKSNTEKVYLRFRRMKCVEQGVVQVELFNVFVSSFAVAHSPRTLTHTLSHTHALP